MKKLFTLLTLLLTIVGGAKAVEATITLSGATTRASDRKVENAIVPTIASSSATITTGSCGSSCATSGYWLNTNDGKTCKYGSPETTYYLCHATQNNAKVAWNDAGMTNQYGTFTIPSGHTFKITNVRHALASQSATFTASIIVKDGASNAKYTSASITVPAVSNGGTATATNIVLAAGDQVTLNAGTYTLNVNISSTNTGTGKYCGIAQVVLTGNLETAAADTNSPEITTDLDDENAYTAYLGVEKTLSIEANHVTGYQWYTCTNAAGDGASVIDGATNYVYAFTPSVAGTYYYKCVATNDNATGTKTATSKVATVNVEAQTPVFSLTNTSILVGGTSQIKVGSKAGLDGLTMTGLTYDDTVISIDATGAITALAKGTTTITFTTAASGNYAAGSADLSITVTGKVVASSTPNSWTGATSRTWSVSKIAFGGAGEEGDNGLYFKTGTSNSINYSSGDFFSLKAGNIMYLEVPSATSTGIVTVKSTQTNERYLQVVNSEGTQNLRMSTSGNSVRFDANSIEEIDGKYYVKLSHGDGECKIAVTNFATVSLVVTITPAKEYTTYVTKVPLDFTGLELKAYVATTATASAVTMEPVTTVPANTPLVLKKGSAASYDVPVIASASAPATNNLRASDGVASIGGDGVYDYILSDGKFYHASAGVLPAGKCYLHLDAAPSGARELSLSFEDEATGVNDVKGQKEEGRDEFYNLAGQRVAQPTKGLYIVNGKKVIVK